MGCLELGEPEDPDTILTISACNEQSKDGDSWLVTHNGTMSQKHALTCSVYLSDSENILSHFSLKCRGGRTVLDGLAQRCEVCKQGDVACENCAKKECLTWSTGDSQVFFSRRDDVCPDGF